jgi:hypothetical protein
MDVRLYLRRGDPHRGFIRTGEWWPKADDALRGPGGEAERTGELMLRARAAALLPRGPGARLAPRAWTPAAPALSPVSQRPGGATSGNAAPLGGSNYWSAVLPLGLTGPSGELNAWRLCCATRPALRLRRVPAAASRSFGHGLQELSVSHIRGPAISPDSPPTPSEETLSCSAGRAAVAARAAAVGGGG